MEILADGVTLFQENCHGVIPTLSNIDHVISDPPYEDELHKAMGRIRRSDGQDMVQELGFIGINSTRAEISKLVVTVSSGWVLLFCLAEGVRAWRDDLQASGAKWDTTLAWIKPDSMPRFNGQGAARGFECIVSAWCGKGYRSWNGGGKRGVFEYPCNGDRPGGHPTEKPVALMAELISLYTKPGQMILDPFMGSGTTGVAAVKLGRKFTGIEMDPAFYAVAKRRITEALEQPDMFIPVPKLNQVEMF